MAAPEHRAVHGLVSGRVQGVFYRASFQRTASSLGLTGWVRNLADGRVEFLVQGAPEGVRKIVDWAGEGPAHARVAGVDCRDVAFDPGLTDFEIRR